VLLGSVRRIGVGRVTETTGLSLHPLNNDFLVAIELTSFVVQPPHFSDGLEALLLGGLGRLLALTILPPLREHRMVLLHEEDQPEQKQQEYSHTQVLPGELTRGRLLGSGAGADRGGVGLGSLNVHRGVLYRSPSRFQFSLVGLPKDLQLAFVLGPKLAQVRPQLEHLPLELELVLVPGLLVSESVDLPADV